MGIATGSAGSSALRNLWRVGWMYNVEVLWSDERDGVARSDAGWGQMSEANEGACAIDLAPGSGDPSGGGLSAVLKVRDDLRLVLVGLGGGGVNVTRAVARRRLPHLETVAINCDPRVQSFEEFDRLLYLGPENAEATGTGGSPLVGGMLARAAEPRLRSIFEDAPFVTIVASLGGGSGSGLVLPILELASRYAHHVTAFVIKPFACEGDRRGIAERTIGRIHFLEQFNDRASRGQARLEVLDNQALVPRLGNRSFSFVPAYWANVFGS